MAYSGKKIVTFCVDCAIIVNWSGLFDRKDCEHGTEREKGTGNKSGQKENE